MVASERHCERCCGARRLRIGGCREAGGRRGKAACGDRRQRVGDELRGTALVAGRSTTSVARRSRGTRPLRSLFLPAIAWLSSCDPSCRPTTSTRSRRLHAFRLVLTPKGWSMCSAMKKDNHERRDSFTQRRNNAHVLLRGRPRTHPTRPALPPPRG